LVNSECSACRGKRLQAGALSVRFAGLDIAELSRVPLGRLRALLLPVAAEVPRADEQHPERVIVAQRIAADLIGRLDVLLELGLGYLTLERSTPSLSPGELQRLRLATQVRSNPVRRGVRAR
jgi:excinuclease ABC subunit A